MVFVIIEKRNNRVIADIGKSAFKLKRTMKTNIFIFFIAAYTNKMTYAVCIEKKKRINAAHFYDTLLTLFRYFAEHTNTHTRNKDLPMTKFTRKNHSNEDGLYTFFLKEFTQFT